VNPLIPAQILKQYFGYDEFREGQSELVDALMHSRDALGIMPTGAGKSLCYQIPAMLLPGVTFTVGGNLLSVAAAVVQGLEGFTAFGDVEWANLGSNQWQGSIVLGVYSGQTRSGTMDIGKLGLDAVKLGDANVTVTNVTVYGIDIVGGAAQSNERATVISPASATTRVFSVYDLNGDNEVGWADLSLAFFYYQSRQGDADWEFAKAADVNGDGKVDMEDLVAIYANFLPK